jgi:hypothetical protein
LSAIIRRATEKEPAARYPSVEAFAHDVRRFLVDEEVSVAPDSLARKMIRSMQRHPGRAVALLACLLLSLAALAVLSFSRAASRAELARQDSETLSLLASQTVVDAKGIEHYLLGLDAELRGLAEVTRLRLEQPLATGTTVPELLQPIDLREGKVPGLVKSQADGVTRSYREPVFVFLPQSKPQAQEAAHRLAVGKADLIDLYVSSIDEQATLLARNAQEALMATDHLGLVRLMITLESGLFVQFPARGDFPAGYDPRTSDWYQRAVASTGSTFTRPKYGPLGKTPRLAFVRAVRSKGQVLGAVASGIWLKTVVSQIGKSGAPGLQDAFLAGRDGKELISQAVLASALRTPGASEAPVALPDVRSLPLKQALAGGREQGYVIDGKDLYFYSRLAVEDWVMVHRYSVRENLRLLR